MNVAKLRKKLGFTQVDLARVLGVHSLTVSRWERGILKPSPHQRAILRTLARSDDESTTSHPAVEELLGLLNSALVDVSEITDMQISASNQFRGKIVELEFGPVTTRLVIEVAPKVRVTSLITTASAKRLGLKLGKRAVAIIKATEVIVATD